MAIQHGMACNWFLNILIVNTSRQVSVGSAYGIFLNNYNSLTLIDPNMSGPEMGQKKDQVLAGDICCVSRTSKIQ